jgi:hypothetical protein
MKANSMRAFYLALAFPLFILLSACGNVPLTYEPTMANLEALRTDSIAPASVGSFSLAPGKPAELDQSVRARAVTVVPPQGASFSSVLGDALKKELAAAGKLDPQSSIVISGQLTRSELSVPIGTGHGELGARFQVSRGGKSVFDREFLEKAEWPSAIVGAEAIPVAITQYTSLYKKLLHQLFVDRDFRAAMQADKRP